MPKRKTVTPNLEFVLPLIKKKCRNNVAFCEQMGKPTRKTWVSEWRRTHNLPSPEEAAQMCVLLDAEPEDILLGTGNTDEETAKLQADIALVRELVEKQSIKKDLTVNGEVNKPDLVQQVRDTDDEDVLLAVLDEINRKLQARRK